MPSQVFVWLFAIAVYPRFYRLNQHSHSTPSNLLKRVQTCRHTGPTFQAS